MIVRNSPYGRYTAHILPRMMRCVIGVLLVTLLWLLVFSRAAHSGDEFDWRNCAGESLLVLLNQHPYAEAIIQKMDEFESLTGIKVSFLMLPEEDYFPRLERSFTARSGKPDVFMTGAYQVWEYAANGQLAELDSYITNPLKTRINYSYRDFYPGISGSFRWSGKAGQPTGEGTLWAVPIGFETNCLTYNREVLANYRLMPPKSLEEMTEVGAKLKEFGGEGTYGVTVRGANDWNSLHSGYMTAFVNYNAKDMEIENGRLVSRVNSPEAVKVTELWLKMIKEAGPPNWKDYTWYKASADLGARKAALMFDADILGYFVNVPGASSQSGRLALAPPPMPRDAGNAPIRANLWVWGLAMNSASERKDAAWLFIQFFTGREFQLYSVLQGRSINPPRRSVFEAPAFQAKMASMEDFSKTFSSLIEGTTIYFTPNPHFFEIARRWVATLHNIADGRYPSVQAGMDDLKKWMDERLADVKVE